ncbi:MAG: gamma carbonic anhydrase family protein [Deltaproteobacteria bacterium]|nr:gamma carbonic anhydrase family protein [Deltaproteobacteria bacterium]
MIIPHHGKWPKIHETAFIAPTADIIGEVEIGDHSSVWFQTVIRGDVHFIKIGNHTNIQDRCLLHVTKAIAHLEIGDEVTVGHSVTLHGCKIGNLVLVGMGAIILDHAEIGAECIIGAGSLITKKTIIPPRSLVLGSPAKVIRKLTPNELASLSQSAQNYVQEAKEYRASIRGPKKVGNPDRDLDFLDIHERDE